MTGHDQNFDFFSKISIFLIPKNSRNHILLRINSAAFYYNSFWSHSSSGIHAGGVPVVQFELMRCGRINPVLQKHAGTHTSTHICSAFWFWHVGGHCVPHWFKCSFGGHSWPVVIIFSISDLMNWCWGNVTSKQRWPCFWT